MARSFSDLFCGLWRFHNGIRWRSAYDMAGEYKHTGGHMLRSSLGVVMSTGFLCFGLAAGSASAADAGLYYPAGPPAIDSPFYAPTVVQSHVDLYGGAAFFNFNGDTETSSLFGGAGRANAPFQNGWNLQLDAQGNALIFQEDGPVSFSEFGGYAHLYKRDPNSHAVGVFVGADFPLLTSVYTVGVEGQMYWPQFTLYGQASVASVSSRIFSGHAFNCAAKANGT